MEARFREMIMAKLEDLCPNAENIVYPDEIDEIVRNRWETDMRNNFVGGEQSWTIRLPESISETGVRNRNNRPLFEVTSSDLRECCDPVVSRITSLVIAQVNAALEKDGKLPKYLILVGGFGRFPCEFAPMSS